MFANKPIEEPELQQALKPYSSPDFITHKLGCAGLFVCGHQGTLPLMKLTQEEAGHLLRGAEIDGTGETEPANKSAVLWKLTYDTPPSVNVLYALVPERTATAIQSAHEKSALTSLRELAGCLHGSAAERGELGKFLDYQGLGGGWLPKPPKQLKDATNQLHTDKSPCAFVVFTSIASAKQNPEIQTTAFLINTRRDKDGDSVEILTPENMRKAKTGIAHSYKSAMEFHLRSVIGSPNQRQSIMEAGVLAIPTVLLHHVFLEPRFDRGWPENPNVKETTRQELFAKWQQQAEKVHWGSKQARTLLRDMQARQIREEFGNCQSGESRPRESRGGDKRAFFEQTQHPEHFESATEVRASKDKGPTYR